MRIPSRRFITITVAAAMVGLTTMWLTIGLIMHAPARTLLWIALISIGTGTFGALIGLMILKLMYSNSWSSGEKAPINMTVKPNLKGKMYVEYELDNNNVLSFYSYKYEQSPGTGRARKLLRRALLFAIAAELLAAVVLLVVLGRSYLPFAVIVAAFAVLTILYYPLSPLLTRQSLRGAAARDYGQGRYKLTGKHRLSITPDSVTDVTDKGESTTRWDAVEWMASTDQYLFVAVRGSGPHIVPRRAFASDEAFRQFVDAAKAHHRAATEAGNPGSTKLK